MKKKIYERIIYILTNELNYQEFQGAPPFEVTGSTLLHTILSLHQQHEMRGKKKRSLIESILFYTVLVKTRSFWSVSKIYS